ncbi:hypothetical protein EC968_002804 [Mortierella alpina]|nr:hypothetical protein EC968_002804 [Mortierella alpina]
MAKPVSSGHNSPPPDSDSDSDVYTPSKVARKANAPTGKATRASVARQAKVKAKAKAHDQDQLQDQQLPVTLAHGGRGSNSDDESDSRPEDKERNKNKNQEKKGGSGDEDSDISDAPLAELKKRRQIARGKRRQRKGGSGDDDSDLSDAPLAELKRRRQVARGKRKQITQEQGRPPEKKGRSSKRPRPHMDTSDLFVTHIGFKKKDIHPISSALNSLIAHEHEVERELAFTVLDGYRPDERYRWPVREELLQCIPKNIYMETSEPNEFERQGMAFVDELTGVPKTEDDYSATEDEDDILENESEHDATDEALQERLLERRREAKRRIKAQQERHDDERAASHRLERVQRFFNEEMTAFAQRQYRKGVPYRIKDFDAFQRQTLPRHLNRARRIPVGDLPLGEGQEDELTPIQERAAIFAAEDSLRKVLKRLPYVIRQGAQGKEPEYVNIGLPKPVFLTGGYERGWDTMMAAASLAGIEDRILKKVSHRMKNLLGCSKFSHYHEKRSRAKVATAPAASSDALGEEEEGETVFIDRLSGDEAPKPEEWKKIPKPFYATDKWIDPLDPKYRPDAIKRNVLKRRSWKIRHISQHNNSNNDAAPS